MITPLFLCLYLLFFVVDVVVWWVWSWSNFLIWLWWFHLFMFLLVVSLFRDEFYALAEKYQTRIVFSPRVYAFFSLASWLFLTALLFTVTFPAFLARGVLFSLLIFRFWVQLFDFFPVKTRQVQRVVFWSSLLGVASVGFLVWWSLGNLLSIWINQDTSTQVPEIVSWTYQDDLEEMPTTWTQTVSWISLEDLQEQEVKTGAIVATGSWMTGSTTTWQVISGAVILKINEPITYRMLLPYLNTLWLLPAIGDTPTFANITRQDPVYQSFQRARGLKMIGTNVNPDWQVRCENLMVLIWLAKNRTVSNSLPVLDAYWQEATKRDMLWSCTTRTQVATQDILKILN